MDDEPSLEDPQLESEQLVVTTILFETGLGVAAAAVGWLLGYLPWATISPGEQAKMGNLAAIAWGLAATVPIFLGLVVIDRLPWAPFRHLREIVEDGVLRYFRRVGMAEIILVALAAGWGEELLFRGFLQALLAADSPVFWRQVVALVLASLVFGVCHWMSHTYAVLASLMGFYLGAIWLATGNLLTPITCHAAYDFLAIVYLLKTGPREPVSDDADQLS